MGYQDNRLPMQQLAASILSGMLNHINPLLIRENNRAYLPYTSLPTVDKLHVSPDQPPSSRLTCDIALGYLADYLQTNNLDHREIAIALLRHAFTRQGKLGQFVWNYGQYEIDQVDLGTVLDTYHYFITRCPDLPTDIHDSIIQSTTRAIDFLKTMEQPEYPGIIRKRAADPDHPDAKRSANYFKIDVLNGNALASTAYCRGATILNQPEFYDLAARFNASLIARFGAHVPGWWAYTEWLHNREMISRETILYQAMTALYLQPIALARPDKSLDNILTQSLQSIEALTSPTGQLDWAHEGNPGFAETQLLMFPSAAAALHKIHDATDAGLARLQFVADNLVDPHTGLLKNEVGQNRQGEIADELRQIWAVSDLALITLFTTEKD